jgi:hypothetical protein
MKSKLACHSPLLAPCSKLASSLVFAGSVLFSAAASGQAVLDKTTLGESQNDYRDLQNSLIVPKRTNFGKEKKEEVDLKTLQTKSSKDTIFQGTLMDLDVDWHGDKLGKPKSDGDKDSKAPKSAGAGGEKDSKVSKQADKSGESGSQDANFTAGGREPLANRPREAGDSVSGKPRDAKASKATQVGDDQNKDQKAKSAKSDEKPSEKEKAAASKPEGDH